MCSCPSRRTRRLERLHPRPELHFPCPGTAVLSMDVEVGPGDRIGLQEAVSATLTRAWIALLLDAAVYDEMRDVDVLGLQLTRHALSETAQAEFPHGERRRLGVALDAGGGAREQDRAVAALQHLPPRGLAYEKPAVAGHHERLLDLDGIQLDQWSAGAVAGVVDHHVGCPQVGCDGVEQRRHLRAAAGVAGVDPGFRIPGQGLELLWLARGERYFHTVLGEEPSERRAQAASGAADEGGFGHAAPPMAWSRNGSSDKVWPPGAKISKRPEPSDEALLDLRAAEPCYFRASALAPALARPRSQAPL